MTGIPDMEQSTFFFSEDPGCYDLLCCPRPATCIVNHFEADNHSGGEPKYKIRMSLSHSEHVPRYQVHLVMDGAAKYMTVGHMEKIETHLRSKPGEFIRVQVWKLTCNSMVWESRRSALERRNRPCRNAVRSRPTPSTTDMLMMGMTIATQAKVECNWSAGHKHEHPVERWVQKVGIDNREYKMKVEAYHGTQGYELRDIAKTIKDLSVLKIYEFSDGAQKRVCTARKQRFGGTLGCVEQPYLGVQIKKEKNSHIREGKDEEDIAETKADDSLASMLNTRGLMLLLMCLAWSEDTLAPQIESTRLTDRFVKAMREKRGKPGSAQDIGLSEQWDTEDVRRRLKHIPYAAFHSWGEEADVEAGGRIS